MRGDRQHPHTKQSDTRIYSDDVISDALGLFSSLLRYYEQTDDIHTVHGWVLSQLKSLIHATAASLFVAEDEGGRLICTQVSGGRDITGLVLEDGCGIAGAVYQTQQAQISPAVQEDIAHFNQSDSQSGFKTVNMITIPLSASGRRFGVIQLLNKSETDIITDFTHQDLSIADIAARMMAQAMLAIEMAEQRAQDKILEMEASQAAELQHLMLRKPDADGLFSASMRSARQLGGDFYDFYIQKQHLFFCIGDVAGKGLPAALLMSCCLSLFRAHHWETADFADFITQLNEVLLSLNSQRFVIMSVGCIHLDTRLITLMSCGHSDILCDDTKTVSEQRGRWIDALIPPLGIAPIKYLPPPSQFHLASGQRLVMCTDGVVEQFGDDAYRARDALAGFLSSLPDRCRAADLTAAICAELDSRRKQRSDDETVCIIA